jgi:hypothetical protein
MEFDAVLLALPPTLSKVGELDLLEQWKGSLNREARRVLYVGASPARHVLAIGAGAHDDRISAILTTATVPVRVLYMGMQRSTVSAERPSPSDQGWLTLLVVAQG